MDEEPVEILVKLAESGEIDPWNINIVEVTDRFLIELERMQKLDLRVSGRTLFFASTLLRMKSDYLNEPEESSGTEGDFYEEDSGFGEDDVFSMDEFAEPVDRLEREIQRRIKRKDRRKRPVTLYELIKELKTAEKMFRRRQRRTDIQPEIILDAEDVVSVAHDEDFSDAATTVYDSYHKLSEKEKEVPMSEICSDLGKNLRSVYLPLLFLMLEGRVVLKQKEFFGEITVSEWSPSAFDSE
ncbi:segregation and condensation protein A [Methanomicrobium sp. W14]|uniref:segregation and condensation protein A n=1 Tax=Methanomicrobium sp. W14 TaxID=2817839 RepID=UPI001AE85974|nr:ScpA family protein [Methanomicrobium sp. W14]MBP2133934.1 segregation and condensation protein A [Methanomicrobium sp. W14]